MYGDRALDSSYRAKNSRARAAEYRTDSVRPFLFDPNTVDRDGLLRLGFSPKQADGIVHYRQARSCFPYGRRLRALPYGVGRPLPKTGTLYPDRFGCRAPRRTSGEARCVGFGFRPGRVERSRFGRVSRGEGDRPLTAGRIVRYRERLGGFARIGQLREIEGMTDENYRRILQQIWVDSSKIQKIDINFALPLQLRDHPYLPERVLNRLLKYRQLKGGWRSIRDLTEQHIISEQQAEKLSPYLCFRVQ